MIINTSFINVHTCIQCDWLIKVKGMLCECEQMLGVNIGSDISGHIKNFCEGSWSFQLTSDSSIVASHSPEHIFQIGRTVIFTIHIHIPVLDLARLWRQKPRDVHEEVNSKSQIFWRTFDVCPAINMISFAIFKQKCR